MESGKTGRSWGSWIASILFDSIKPGPPRRREIWLQWYRRSIFPGVRVVHWKGRILMFAPLLLVAGFTYVSESRVPVLVAYRAPFLVAYFAAASVYLMIHWMLVLDHSEWEGS